MNSHLGQPLNITLPDRIEYFLQTLLARASAKTLAGHLGFIDRPAELLVEKMGAKPLIDRRHFNLRDYQEIIRCAWFDEKLVKFFETHPKAMGIDIGSGFNTRFQRISQRLDWPQFKWVDMDEPQLTAIKSRLIPVMDNYNLAELNQPLLQQVRTGSWRKSRGWEPGTPLIIIIDDTTQDLCREGLIAILNSLSEQAGNTVIEVIFDHRTIQTLSHTRQLLNLLSIPIPQPKTSFATRTLTQEQPTQFSQPSQLSELITQQTSFTIKSRINFRSRLTELLNSQCHRWLSWIKNKYRLETFTWEGFHLHTCHDPPSALTIIRSATSIAHIT